MRLHDLNPNRFQPFRVAKAVGATVGEVLRVVAEAKGTPGTFSGDLARATLAPYVVASRRATDAGWNNEDPGVMKARRGYEAGTHDMATHREGKWLHLCSFPLARPVRPRPRYFTGAKL